MDKYADCNVVETVSTSKTVKSEKHRSRAPVVRFIVAAAIVGVFCAVKYIPSKPFEYVKSALHSVFCYDVFGRSDFGTAPAFSALFELVNKSDGDTDADGNKNRPDAQNGITLLGE